MKAIIAVNKNMVIGHAGGLPWPKSKADMAHFVESTTDAQIIVGRKTWDELPQGVQTRIKERAQVLVASRDPERGQVYIRGNTISYHQGRQPKGAVVVSVPLSGLSSNTICIGGAELYRACAGSIREWLVTTIDDSSPGDTSLEPFWQDQKSFGLYEERVLDERATLRIYCRWAT